MGQINLNGLKLVPEQKAAELLGYLHSYYKDGMSVGQAYDDIVHAIQNGKYANPKMSRAVLDGARASRNAEMAHILDLIFVKLRDFFEQLEYGQTE